METSNQIRSPVLQQHPHQSLIQNDRPFRSNPTQPFTQSSHHHHHDHNNNEEEEDDDDEDPASKYDVYKDFNNTGIRYVNIVENPEEPIQTNHERTEQETRSNLMENPREKFILAKDPTQKSTSKAFLHRNRTHQENQSLRKRWGWRLGAVITFVVLACLAVAIYFLIPRQPAISFNKPISLIGNSTSAHFNPQHPTEFSFEARLSMALDGRSSYIPARITTFEVFINDLGSTPDSVLVGKGKLEKDFTASTKSLTPVEVDVQFQYTASAQTDALWQAWRQGCANIEASKRNGTVTRPALQLSLVISFNMMGIVGARGDNTQLNGVSCPIELPA
ncbi:hypothetical protein DFH28DRAFT_127837 [Melampsora americana]|nr:hypothetical protein DFH28DRAFT_127837 [Melampsora americana]